VVDGERLTAPEPLGAYEPPGAPERLAFIREEIRSEISLLHERVNALVQAEAFLTIAFTGAMSGAAPGGDDFSAVVGPVLSVLGLLLALLAWPGIEVTVRTIRTWTARRTALLRSDPALTATVWGIAAQGRGEGRHDPDHWRSMLFFRTAPGLFVVVWTVLTAVAVLTTR